MMELRLVLEDEDGYTKPVAAFLLEDLEGHLPSERLSGSLKERRYVQSLLPGCFVCDFLRFLSNLFKDELGLNQPKWQCISYKHCNMGF